MTLDSGGSADQPLIGYLGDEWLRAADQAVRDLTPIPSAVIVAVQVDRDNHEPPVRYRLVLGPDRVRLLADDEPGQVLLIMSYQTACAIAQGRLGARRAFLDGDIRLGGDSTALLGHQRQLAEIDDRLAELRSRTRF